MPGGAGADVLLVSVACQSRPSAFPKVVVLPMSQITPFSGERRRHCDTNHFSEYDRFPIMNSKRDQVPVRFKSESSRQQLTAIASYPAPTAETVCDAVEGMNMANQINVVDFGADQAARNKTRSGKCRSIFPVFSPPGRRFCAA